LLLTSFQFWPPETLSLGFYANIQWGFLVFENFITYSTTQYSNLICVFLS
jgi:hypothetical protein